MGWVRKVWIGFVMYGLDSLRIGWAWVCERKTRGPNFEIERGQKVQQNEGQTLEIYREKPENFSTVTKLI